MDLFLISLEIATELEQQQPLQQVEQQQIEHQTQQLQQVNAELASIEPSAASSTSSSTARTLCDNATPTPVLLPVNTTATTTSTPPSPLTIECTFACTDVPDLRASPRQKPLDELLASLTFLPTHHTHKSIRDAISCPASPSRTFVQSDDAVSTPNSKQHTKLRSSSTATSTSLLNTQSPLSAAYTRSFTDSMPVTMSPFSAATIAHIAESISMMEKDNSTGVAIGGAVVVEQPRKVKELSPVLAGTENEEEQTPESSLAMKKLTTTTTAVLTEEEIVHDASFQRLNFDEHADEDVPVVAKQLIMMEDEENNTAPAPALAVAPTDVDLPTFLKQNEMSEITSDFSSLLTEDESLDSIVNECPNQDGSLSGATTEQQASTKEEDGGSDYGMSLRSFFPWYFSPFKSPLRTKKQQVVQKQQATEAAVVSSPIKMTTVTRVAPSSPDVGLRMFYPWYQSPVQSPAAPAVASTSSSQSFSSPIKKFSLHPNADEEEMKGAPSSSLPPNSPDMSIRMFYPWYTSPVKSNVGQELASVDFVSSSSSSSSSSSPSSLISTEYKQYLSSWYLNFTRLFLVISLVLFTTFITLNSVSLSLTSATTAHGAVYDHFMLFNDIWISIPTIITDTLNDWIPQLGMMEYIPAGEMIGEEGYHC